MSNKKIISDRLDNNVLSEITRINDLMGVRLISEAIIPTGLSKIINDVLSYGKKTTPFSREVTDAATSLRTYLSTGSGPIQLDAIADDLYSLANAKPEFRQIIGEYLTNNPTIKSQLQTIENKITDSINTNQIDLSVPSNQLRDDIIDTLENYYITFYNSQNVAVPSYLPKFLDIIITDDFITKVVTPIKVARKSEALIKSDFNWWNTWFSSGKKIAEEIKKDLDILASAKTGGKLESGAVDASNQRIFNNLQFLYRDRRKAYDKLIAYLETLKTGTTNVKNAEEYETLINGIKQRYGDWTIIEEISALNPTFQKYWKEISEAVKSAYKLETNVVKFLISPAKIISSLYQKIVEKGIASFTINQAKTVGPTLLNWLITFSPRGLPLFDVNLKNYDDIVKLSARYPGAIRSFVYEVVLRMSKTAGYLSAAYVVYSWWLTLTRNSSWFGGKLTSPLAENCLNQLVDAIQKKDMDIESSVEYINKGNLSCIYELNLNEEDISDMIIIGMYKAGGTGFWNFMKKVTIDLYNRVMENPKFAGPPIFSLNELWKDFENKGLGGVITDTLPEVKLPNTQNPLPINPPVNPVTPNPVQPGPRARF